MSLMGYLSCENTVLWRGHFKASGQETSVNLSINGGQGEYRVLSSLSSRLTFNSFRCQRLVEFTLPGYFIWQVCEVHRSVMRWQ